MELWIPITILAAFSQNIRSALQKHLTEHLSTVGATQARFFYAVPFSLVYVTVLCRGMGFTLPTPNLTFIFYTLAGGIFQILATALLVGLFSYRNFFIGTSYSKTETIQTALLGFFILSDNLSFGAIIGISLGIFGVMIISSTKNNYHLRGMIRSLKSKSALMGILAGLFFGISAVCFRGASLSLQGGYMIQAAFTLTTVLIFQTLAICLYLIIKEPGQLSAVVTHWRLSWLVGLTGMIASACWFTAMTLQNAGHVRALGQIELVFAFLASAVFFKEKSSNIELLGIVIIVTGILILLLYK